MKPASRSPQRRRNQPGKARLLRTNAEESSDVQDRDSSEPASPPDAARETISFKADRHLLLRLRELSNRSDFIRLAVLKALNQVCPTCGGTGLIGQERLDNGCP